MQEDIAAIAAKVGKDGSADTSSLDYMVALAFTDITTLGTTVDNRIDDVLDGSEAFTTPDIPDFTNAIHDHENNAGGGVLGTAALADSGVTPAKLLAGTGTSWSGSSWSPTLSGRLNDSKWDKSGSYQQIGKIMFADINLIASTTTPVDGGTADFLFTLPATAASFTATGNIPQIGEGVFFDANGALYHCTVNLANTTTGIIRPLLASGTYVTPTTPTSTVPFTWTTSDEISLSIRYRVP